MKNESKLKNIIPTLHGYAPNHCYVKENTNFLIMCDGLEFINFPYIKFGKEPLVQPIKLPHGIKGMVPMSYIPVTVNLYFVLKDQSYAFGQFTYKEFNQYEYNVPIPSQIYPKRSNLNDNLTTLIDNRGNKSDIVDKIPDKYVPIINLTTIDCIGS